MTTPTNHDIDNLILQIKGLVFVHALLEARGASWAELAQHRAELARQRRRLEQLVLHGAA